MRRPRPVALIIAAALISSYSGALSAQAPAPSEAVRDLIKVDAPTIVLRNVKVIDGTGAPAKDNQTIVISNGRISAINPARPVTPGPNVQILDLAGSTVIPGMVGLHDHSYYTTSMRNIQQNFSAPRLYLGSGVTTIRTTGSNYPYAEINLKKLVDNAQVPGPHMFITGPYLTGENASTSMINLTSPEDARRAVAYWADEGVSWFKFYTGITRDEAKAAIDEAHKRGVKVTGHICSLSFAEAVELGMDGVEHGLLTNSEYSPTKVANKCPNDVGKTLQTLDVKSAPVQATIQNLVSHKVPMTSTLVVYELFVANRPPLEQRVLDAMSPETRSEYLTARARISEAAGIGIPAESFRKAMQFEYDFYKAGGLLAAGVDPTGNGGALPGYGDQRNYELLIEAGFTPVEAIQVLSFNGARVLGIDKDYGSVEVGKKADLVVLNGDIIAKPADIRKTTIVFKDGVGFDSQKMLDSVKGQVGVR